MADESVGELAELYLGNLLYALERCAMALEAEQKPDDAALLDLMAGYPALIRRPIVVIDGAAQIGLNQPALKAAVGITKDKA